MADSTTRKRWNEERQKVVGTGGAVSVRPTPIRPAAASTAASAVLPGPTKAASLSLLSFPHARHAKPEPQQKRPSSSRGNGSSSRQGSTGSGSSRKGGSSRPSSGGGFDGASSGGWVADGDVSSSRPSSGGWSDGALTGSSNNDGAPNRARSTPPDSRALYMPDPIRRSPLFPSFLGGNPLLENTEDGAEDDDGDPDAPGNAVRHDPYGRDAPRHHAVKTEWSVDRLVNYLQIKAVRKIDSGLQSDPSPKDEKLNTFVKRLIAHIKRENAKAPKKVRPQLHDLFSKRIRKFWNFERNEKVRPINPEELLTTLQDLIEALKDPDFQSHMDTSSSLMQVAPPRTHILPLSAPRPVPASVIDDIRVVTST